MNFLSIDDILGIHTFLAREFGGSAALRDREALREAVTALASGKHTDVFEKAALLLSALAVKAPFEEGNLRTAFFAADVFLRLNGYFLRCDNVLTQRFFTGLMEEGAFTADTLLPWVKANVEKKNP